MKCVICRKEIIGYGNNAEPIRVGRCCDECNEHVIKARLNISLWKEICKKNLYQTCGINSDIENDVKFAKEIMKAFGKYTVMNWGDTCASDKRMNNKAVMYGDERIVAKYKTSKGNIFIITEWDRSATTILFASEY